MCEQCGEKEVANQIEVQAVVRRLRCTGEEVMLNRKTLSLIACIVMTLVVLALLAAMVIGSFLMLQQQH